MRQVVFVRACVRSHCERNAPRVRSGSCCRAIQSAAMSDPDLVQSLAQAAQDAVGDDQLATEEVLNKVGW